MTTHEGQLQLNLLGPPQVLQGDQSLNFPTRKTLALLIYLAVEREAQPRELLAALLWPEADRERSYASLRNTLGHLRAALSPPSGKKAGPPYLSVTHSTLMLNQEADIRVDLYQVEQAYNSARADRSRRTVSQDTASLSLLQKAASCYRGDFLAGFSLSDALTFDDWASIQREIWGRRLGLILDRLSEIQFARGEFDAAAEAASHWITLDILNEVAYRRKMRAHFAAGGRGQALETYETCRTALLAELGAEPAPDTEALAQRIRTQHPIRYSIPHNKQPNTPVTFIENLFAGRTVEHQELVRCFENAVAERPQVVVLRGELGIGKTRLGRAFVAWAVGRGAESLEGRAFESGSRMSYQPLIDAFRPVFEREGTLIDEMKETWLAPLSHLFPELRERYPELPAVYLDMDGGRTALFEALLHMTVMIAGRSPLVLFFDDLQWADSATLDWLVYAIRRWNDSDNMRILLLVSLRSEALQPSIRSGYSGLNNWLVQVEREIEPLHLELGPLNEQDTVEMVLSIMSPPAIDFAQWLFYETRGQPFYLMETLKDLLERRVLHSRRQAGDQWAFEVDAEHDLGKAVRVPSTVRAVILSRLNRLSPSAFALLVAGAILEQRLTFEHLCFISNLAEDIGLPALDELVSGRLLLEVEQIGAVSAYTFSHNIIRDVIYTEAGDARRRYFHRRALELLESSGDSAAVLAYHAVAARQSAAAFRYSLIAGQEALNLAAVSEAKAHLEKALQLAQEELSDSSEIQAYLRDLYFHLAQAYELSSQPQQARLMYDKMQRLPPK